MTGRVEKSLQRSGVGKGSEVGAAVSGGIDSMALLHCLCALREKMGFELKAFHFEHGIRAQRSKEDMEFVMRECEKLGVLCVTGGADVPRLAREKGVSVETAAREARYAFLDAQRCDFIATAHHSGDNAETVLLNLIRGSGLKGLCGIPEKRGKYIRPFLDISRSEIEEYVNRNGIPYSNDATNDDISYSRNYIRKEILPRLSRVNGSAAQNISRAARLLSEDEEALEETALESGCIEYARRGAYIDLELLQKQKEAVKKRVIRLAAQGAGGLYDLENIHTEAVLRLAEKGESGKRLDLAHGLCAEVVYGRLRIVKHEERGYCATPAPLREGSFEFGGYAFECREFGGAPVFEKGAEYFDKEAAAGAQFRFRKEGDFIRPLGMKGRKRLSDYLSDRKVPLSERDSLVLMARGSEILWVVGVGVSESSKVNGGEQIYEIKYKELGDGRRY